MLADATGDVVELVTAAGLEATDDPRNLNLPGCWVTPAAIQFDRMAGTTGSWELYLVAPDTGPRESLRTLDGMLRQLRGALGASITGARVAGVNLANHGGGDLPALQVSIELEITED